MCRHLVKVKVRVRVRIRYHASGWGSGHTGQGSDVTWSDWWTAALMSAQLMKFAKLVPCEGLARVRRLERPWWRQVLAIYRHSRF